MTISFMLLVSLASAFFAGDAVALNGLAESSAEYCRTATRQAPEEVRERAGVSLRDLEVLDDEEYRKAAGLERSVVLGVAGDWTDIESHVLERGPASASATKTLASVVFSGRAELVEKLIELGVPPAAGAAEEIPLTHAAMCGYNDIAKILLRSGANPNATTTQGQDAMLQAVVQDNQALGRLLMDYGYDPCVMVLDDGRNLNDMIDHMDESNDGHPAFWQDFKCREGGLARLVQ